MDSVTKAIEDAVAQTLETLAFMDVSTAYEEIKFSNGMDFMQSVIDLKTPLSGEMIVAMPSSLLDMIAHVVFADSMEPPEPPPDPSQENENDSSAPDEPAKAFSEEILNDILGEVLNTLAGNFMSLIVSNDQTFIIGFPKTTKETPDNSSWNWLSFVANDINFGVAVTLT